MDLAATRYLLGLRPEIGGLRIDPKLPSDWSGFTATRRFRGCMLEIEVRRSRGSETRPKPMCRREKFPACPDRRPITGRVPTFKSAFYLTMEAPGTVHPCHRLYEVNCPLLDTGTKEQIIVAHPFCTHNTGISRENSESAE